MQIKREDLGKNKVKLTISLDGTEWNALLDKAATKVAESTKIEGFRAGKAPRDVVITKVGEARVLSEAIELGVEEYYPKAAREENLRPVAFPALAVDKATMTDALVFSAEVAVMPEVKLGDYSKLKVEKEVLTVTDEMVAGTVEDLRKKAAERIEVVRAAAEGDLVEIDFVGSVDGVEFEGGASKNHPLVLGDKTFIPGFEEGVVGMNVGEEKEIEVTFPAEYHAQNLAGKPAKFKVKLHKVQETKLPEIDDALAAKVSRFATLQELQDDIRKFMIEEAERKAMDLVKERAITELVNISEVEIPEELVDQELNSMINDLRTQVAHAQMSFEDYLKKADTDEAGLRAQWREQGEKRVKAGLALDAFRRAENIEVTHDEIHAEIDRLKEQYPEQAEDIEQHYGGHNHAQLENMLVSKKAVERLVEIVSQ